MQRLEDEILRAYRHVCGGKSPEEVQRLINKGQAYEDLEEQGLLVKLPCKVGDTVYIIQDKKIYTETVQMFYIAKSRKSIHFKVNICGAKSFGDLGKTVFLTKESAIKALEGKE